jgi:hypothetical protein
MLPVLGKVQCIFEYARKENGCLDGGKTHDKLIDGLLIEPTNYIVTAKMDGTCCYIKDGQIFARQDVKKNIANAPSDWFPTAGTEPDRGGHIIGFRPLDRKRGDKWHLMAIDEQDSSKARFLEYDSITKSYYYVTRSIADFNGKTCELVGPSVNANKHELDKHAYIIHGCVKVNAPWRSHLELKEWLDGSEGIIYEGIVIHDLGNNTLYKCHRGHLGGSHIWEGNPLPMRD